VRYLEVQEHYMQYNWKVSCYANFVMTCRGLPPLKYTRQTEKLLLKTFALYEDLLPEDFLEYINQFPYFFHCVIMHH